MKHIDIKNYGLVVSPRDEKAYVLGGGQLPKIVLREDGQWDEFLPQYEPQFNENYDSSGCTVWGTQNAEETILKLLTGVEYNFSERYNYILARVRPPGADPHWVAEIIRKYGVIEDYWLPFTTTYEEFLTPDPMSLDLLAKGQEFPYELQHEWLWQESQTKEKRMEIIKEYLRYGPLCVSVTAWIYDDETETFIDNGMPNTHWCVLYGWNDKGFKIFDSYNQSRKVLSFDHNIQMAKRYVLKKKEIEQPIKEEIISHPNWLIEILKNLISFFQDIAKKYFTSL